jgi:ABC-2 type transport system permease protein
LRELVKTDFKLRYQGSAIGYTWSLLKPIMLFAIMYVVFVNFLKFGQGIPHYTVILLLGIVMWTFFVEATGQGMQAIVSRGDLIRKIKFPKYIIVISSTVSALINLLLNLVVVVVFMLFDGVNFGWSAFLFPVSILLLYVFSLSLAFLLSAIYVKYRDIAPIWEITTQALFYGTPIIYPLQMVVAHSLFAAKILMLSPIAMIFQDARLQLVGGQDTITTGRIIENPIYLIVPYGIIFIIGMLAIFYFKKSQKTFAENL